MAPAEMPAILAVTEEAAVRIQGSIPTRNCTARFGRRGLLGGVVVQGSWNYDEEADTYDWSSEILVKPGMGILLDHGDRVVVLFRGEEEDGVEFTVAPLPNNSFVVTGRGYPPFLSQSVETWEADGLPAPREDQVLDGMTGRSAAYLDPDGSARLRLLKPIKEALAVLDELAPDEGEEAADPDLDVALQAKARAMLEELHQLLSEPRPGETMRQDRRRAAELIVAARTLAEVVQQATGSKLGNSVVAGAMGGLAGQLAQYTLPA